MNSKILKLIDAKLITSVGGVLLAGALAFILYKVLSNDLSHVSGAILRQAEVQQDTNNVLREQTRVLEANAQILSIIERRVR